MLRVGLGLSHLSSSIMPNLENVCVVIRILHMTEAEMIKEDVTAIRNKAPKHVKGMHPKRSLIWKRMEVSWSKLALTWGFPNRFLWMLNLDQVASLRGLGLHQAHIIMVHYQREAWILEGGGRDDGEVSLLVSNEGIPDPP